MDNINGASVIEKGEVFEKYFSNEEITDLSIETASAATNIVCSPDAKAYVKYTAGSSKMMFRAEIIGGRLTISEKQASMFGFGAIKPGTLSIELPEKLYWDVKVAVASGSLGAQGLTSEKFGAELASGKIEMNIFASEISVSVASGKAVFSRFSEKTADRISIRTASGIQEFHGFASRETDINSASGRVTMTGVSGSVRADISSGRLELQYAEWNGGLNLKVASGKADITLPAGSGADVNFERVSGSMSIELDDSRVSLKNNSGGIYGGSNVQTARVDVASGSVSIHN